VAGKRRASGPAKKSAASSTAPQRHWFRRLLLWGTASGLVLAIVATVAFVVLYRAVDIPDPNQDFQTQTTYVYYADGKKEPLGQFATQNRNSITYAEMPEMVKDAVVSAEDRSFWTNQGIDPRGILRAAFSNARGGSTQGASTITQQYVKILYLTQEQTYKRKAKEAIMSLKLHRQQSKEQILEGYLNTIYFGRGAYGIDAAARAYFDVPAKRLNLRQSAVLAAVLNNPGRFDPANGDAAKEALEDRYEYVIDGMADTDQVSRQSADRAARQLPRFPKVTADSAYGGQRGHALALVRRELLRTGKVTEDQIDGGGLRVYTTLQRKVMNAAREGVREAKPQGLKDLHAAVATVEVGTGALRGFFGGQDYLDSQINWAVSGSQPGSTFKPFALAAGLEAGFSLKDTFEGNSPFEVGDAEIHNQGEGTGSNFGSSLSLLEATKNSVNTAYVDLTMSLPNGPEDVVDMATRLGVPKDTKARSMDRLHDSPGLKPEATVALGSATVSPINMANAYGTVANDGQYTGVYVIDKVVDRDGEVLYRHRSKSEDALREDVSHDVSYALQENAKSGTGTSANTIGRPIAGKTGTATASNASGKDHVSSSWFVGYTPQLSTAVMYARGKGNEPLNDYLEPFFGGTYPAQTWAAVMRRAMEGMEVESFPPPARVDGEAPESGHEPPPPPKPSPTKTQQKPSESPTKSESSTPTPTQPPTTQEPKPGSPPKDDDCTLLGGCPGDDDTSSPGGGGDGGGGGGGGGDDTSSESPVVQETTHGGGGGNARTAAYREQYLIA